MTNTRKLVYYEGLLNKHLVYLYIINNGKQKNEIKVYYVG